MENTATIHAQAKEVCNRSVTYHPALAWNPRESILAFLFKTEMDSVSKKEFGT